MSESSWVESLYPFLYSDTSDLSAVLDQVRASTVAKAAEIVELRRVVGVRDGARIAECARQAAARFGAGGRLFAFGNGGSATDAAQLATLFLNPGQVNGVAAPPLPAFGLANDTSVVTAPGSWPRSAAGTTSRSGCPPAATRPTWCAPSTRRAGAAC